MPIAHRRYRKFLLSLLILGSTSSFILLYYDKLHSDTLIVYDRVVKNASFLRQNPEDRPIKAIELFKIPNGQTRHMTALLGTERVATSGPRTVKVQNNSSGSTAVNNQTKKTLYPVTLYAPYLLENPTLCSSVQNLSILVIVHTAPAHLKRRDIIRATWTNETYFKHLGRIRVLFLLGRVDNKNIQKDIEEEFIKYGDILQGDFIDAYRNLSHKGVMAYKWLTERCRNAKLILKVDDDVVVNTYDMLTKYLPEYQNKSKQIFCNHIFPGTMLIIRKNTSKWYVHENEFKGKKFYPRYCSGFTVVFTNDVIPALYRAATVTPFFWVDDVYLYGLVPSKVPGIKYNGFKLGDHQLTGKLAINCYRNASRTCNYLITGAGTREHADTIWSFMTKAYESKLLKSSSANMISLPKPEVKLPSRSENLPVPVKKEN